MKLALAGIVSFLCFGSMHAATGADGPDKPNIIYIMTDDLGYGDLGCYGQKTIQTPNIDRMAAEGMRFTDYHAGCTVCRPSRLSLWTGLHMGHTPISSNDAYQFERNETTVPELLKQAGYTTGGVGKWAMGPPDTNGIPIRHGFDFWFGYLDQGEAHNYYPTHLWRCHGNDVEKVDLPGNALLDTPNARGRVTDPKHRVTYSHDVITDEALGFVRRNADKPFLLHIHWTIPHANNEGGRVLGDGMEVPDYGIYKDRDWPTTAKGQAAMITRMDGDVGRLMQLLKELKIDERTLVLFTSDNGPHSEGGHQHEFFDANGPLRGFKRDLYEGGIRVPLIARWPGTIQAKTVSEHLSAFCDFLPTACELAAVDSTDDTDGISLLPTLLGHEQTAHEYLYWRYQTKSAVRLGKWKAVRLKDSTPIELYNLESDIGETEDIAAQHPEIIQRMQAIMEEAYAPPEGGKLLFRSGFEPGVYVTPDYGDIRGADGMDWQQDLEARVPYADRFSLNYCATAPTFAWAKIIDDPTDSGRGRVLHMRTLDDEPDGATVRVQNEYNMRDEEPTFDQGFVRYKVYWHPDLAKARDYPDRIHWWTVMEWWEHRNGDKDGDRAGQCRWTLGWNKERGPDEPFYWRLNAEYMQPEGQKFQSIWQSRDNHDVPCPIGQWCTVEAFFKSGVGPNGRIWVALTRGDGERQVIFDVRDSTKHPADPLPLRGWQFFKLYTSDRLIDYVRNDDGFIQVYFDDVEYWTDFPSAVLSPSTN